MNSSQLSIDQEVHCCPHHSACYQGGQHFYSVCRRQTTCSAPHSDKVAKTAKDVKWML